MMLFQVHILNMNHTANLDFKFNTFFSVDKKSFFCYIVFSDRTGETCEAFGPEGSCGSLSLYWHKSEVNENRKSI